MKKKYRDITVGGEQYAWAIKGYTIKIWKDKKIIHEIDMYNLAREDGLYGDNWSTITPRTISLIILAKDDATRKDIVCKGTNDPYIIEKEIVVHHKYNPYYGDDMICECGHAYYRHFDTYENMEDVGCKYCNCDIFVEAK